MSFVVGVLVSVPTAHSRVIDQDSGNVETMAFHTIGHEIHNPFGHSPDQGDYGKDHNCCSHHCHHCHAMLSNAMISIFDPASGEVQMLRDIYPPLTPAYGLKRPPRTFV